MDHGTVFLPKRGHRSHGEHPKHVVHTLLYLSHTYQMILVTGGQKWPEIEISPVSHSHANANANFTKMTTTLVIKDPNTLPLVVRPYKYIIFDTHQGPSA